MKIDRQKVYEKYNGHCAYCGREITIKEMQVDHIWPKCSAGAMVGTTNSWSGGWPEDGDINSFGNLNPSCRRCNHYKRSLYLEDFRNLMLTLHERIQKQYIDKVAIDYGIITLTPWDGKFYFEKQKDS